MRLLAFDAGLAQTARTLAHHSAVATLGPQLRSFHHRASSLPRALFARPEGDSRPDTGTRQKPYRLGARRAERPPTAGRRVRVFAHYLEPLGGAGLLTGLDRLGVGGRSHVGATCGRPTGTSRPPNLAVRRGCCPVREGHCRPEGDLRSPPPWDVSRAKSVCSESQNCTPTPPLRVESQNPGCDGIGRAGVDTFAGAAEARQVRPGVNDPPLTLVALGRPHEQAHGVAHAR